MLRIQHGDYLFVWRNYPGRGGANAQPVAIRAGRLFDSKSSKMLENQVILTDGERISAVGSADRVQVPAGARVIDPSKGTVLPGLIDGHTHVFGFGLDGIKAGGPPFASPINDSREYRTLLALANAQKGSSRGIHDLASLDEPRRRLCRCRHREGYRSWLFPRSAHASFDDGARGCERRDFGVTGSQPSKPQRQ